MAPDPAGGRAVEAEAERLLADLRLLLLFCTAYLPRVLAARSYWPAQSAVPNPALAPRPFISAAHVGLLGRTAAELATDPNLLEQLYGALAELSNVVAPASVGSIHLTSAFAGSALDAVPPPAVKALARTLVRWFVAMAVVGLAAFIVTIMLLIHTDNGQQAMRRLEEVKLEYQQTVASIADLNASVSKPAGEGACSDTDWRASTSARLQTLCSRLDVLKRRQTAIEQELREWNAASVILSVPARWLGSRTTLPESTTEAEWQAIEFRASAGISDLTGILLPMLLGLLGACAYVFRDLDRQIRTWTLHRGAAAHGVLRLLLGIILGGLLSVFWTSGTAPRVDGVALSLGALAFFVGFGVEIVFQALEGLIAGVARNIGKQS
jgi:hypothetical protein